MRQIPLSDLCFDHQETAAVQQVLHSKWLTLGDETRRFEAEFENLVGGGVSCCAVSSCTAALHMALMLAGVGPGDEVLLPGLTFVADLNVVCMTGAVPVPVDVTSLQDWNISLADMERHLSERTRAVIVVHFAGYPCHMEAISAWCRDQQVVLIEDAAHAVGAAYQDRMCGTWGDCGCFSFFSNKNMAVGEGGMLALRDRETARRAILMRCHGMTHATIDRHHNQAISYDVVMPGLNYRIDEMRAALGRVQLGKLARINERRRELVACYHQALAEMGALTIPWKVPDARMRPAYHIFPVLLPPQTKRPRFMQFLRERGVQTSIHYPSFRDFSFYRERLPRPLPLADDISRRVVTLPLYPGMSEEDVGYIADQINAFFAKGKDSGP